MTAAALIGPRSGMWYPLVLIVGCMAFGLVCVVLNAAAALGRRDEFPEITAQREVARVLREGSKRT